MPHNKQHNLSAQQPVFACAAALFFAIICCGVGCKVGTQSSVSWLSAAPQQEAIDNAIDGLDPAVAATAPAVPSLEIPDFERTGTGLIPPELDRDAPLDLNEAPRPALELDSVEQSTEEPTTTAESESWVETADAPVPSLVTELPWSSGFPEQLEGVHQLPRNTWPLTLDEAIQLAFEDTTVLRSLGAQILNNPEGVPSAHQPWIISSDPRSGTEAALADFDTTLNGQINYANNDDVFNSSVLGGGANTIQQDLVNTSLTWQRFTSTGAQYTLTGAIDYDDNTRPSNLFDSVFNTRLEAEIRQPLLQGRGTQFNSIAGPNSRVDQQGGTGILIAQSNIDVSVVQFERNVTSFVNDIISAYWALHLAYRNVEIARESFEQAEKTWQVAQARRKTSLEGGEAYREALAREQRDRLEVELLEAIHSTGQSNAVGLLQADAQLRLLLNLPSDGQTLLYPIDGPVAQATVFDAESLKHSAVTKRAEIREQNIRVKRAQLQLLAANNFLLPRLDAVATYRNNGFGDSLGNGSSTGFESALDVAADGLFDEWEIGLQYNVTLGARRAQAGVRNSRLRLRRSRQLLKELETRIHFDVETAVRSASRSELTLAASRRLLEAARESYESHQAAFETDLTTIDELLRSQQRLADAQRTYNRQLIDRTLAIEGIFREAGSLLEMHGVKSDCPSCDSNLLSHVTNH